MYQNEIKEFLNANKENIINDLCSLVEIPSVTGTKHCVTALNKCRDMLKTVTDEAITYEDDLYALGKIKGNGKNIGIFTHCDVVPADESEWDYTKPFEPKKIENCLIGRGVEDDKGGFIQALYALKCIKQLNLPLKSGVTFFVGGSEEAGGMRDIISFTENNPMPDISFSPDCEFPFSMGEKSIIHLNLRAKKPFETIKSIKGGTVINAVAGKARAVLITGEEIEAQGISAHAAMPENAVNAIKLLCEKLLKNPNVSDFDKNVLEEISMMQSNFYGSYLGINAQEEGFGKLTCVMGKIDSEDGIVNFTLDIRCGAATDIYETTNHIEELLFEKDIIITNKELLQGFALMKHPAKEALAKTYKDLGFKEEPFISAGGTYSRHLRNSFSIGIVCGKEEPFVKLNSDKGGPHQSDEMICIDRLLNGINVLVNYLLCVDNII